MRNPKNYGLLALSLMLGANDVHAFIEKPKKDVYVTKNGKRIIRTKK